MDISSLLGPEYGAMAATIKRAGVPHPIAGLVLSEKRSFETVETFVQNYKNLLYSNLGNEKQM